MTQQRLRLLFCDHLSLARGKYLPASQSDSGESRFCQGVYALGYDKDLIPAPCSTLFEGLPDMVARYHGDDVRPGWRDGERVVVADQFDNRGAPLPVDGRGLLKRTVEQWRQLGYQPKVGIELEAYAFVRADDGHWQPADTPGAFVYGTGPFTDPDGFTDAIWETAERAGFRLELITSEFDAPQFEFTLRYDDAVAAADEIFLFRLMAREVALDYGVLLTFMPKPVADLSGSGVHINFSLADKAGANAIGDEKAADRLTPLARGCVAGLMRHHRALAGLLAPCVNSYARLQPASLSGFWCNWGQDHRGVTTRISAESGPHARIEHRMTDAAANPYTAIAAVLQAARLGVEGGYELPPAETGDCLESQDASDSVAESLGGALDDLEADADLLAAVGADLAGNLVAIKRDEIEKTAALKGDTLRDFYLHYI